MASEFGKALQSAAWSIGDWLVFGDRKWGRQLIMDGGEFDPKTPNRIPSHLFDSAIESTGLDRQTLSQYASVCRAISYDQRRSDLSFSHHRVLAPLNDKQRGQWLDILDSKSKKPTIKRLSISIRRTPNAPRIISDDEVISTAPCGGQDNYLPHLTRLLTVLRRTIPTMAEPQREALLSDVEQLRELMDRVEDM